LAGNSRLYPFSFKKASALFYIRRADIYTRKLYLYARPPKLLTKASKRLSFATAYFKYF